MTAIDPVVEANGRSTNRIGIEGIREIETASYDVIERLRGAVFAPDGKKTLDRRFTISEVAEMVGRTAATIRKAESTGRLPTPERRSNGRRAPYSLEDVNRMRDLFQTRPWRYPKTDEPAVIGIQNFKGGVGKSTITVHLSHYLALRGYRVCVIDCDPQGSTTSLFGLNPDVDVKADLTLYPFLLGERESIEYAIADTHWDQVSLIPANLDVYSAEYFLAAKMRENPQMLGRLRKGIEGITDAFDVILIDPPPALGMISLSVLHAANALVVPCRPATIDFGSTANFFTMLIEALEALQKLGLEGSYNFLRVLANDMDEGKSAHSRITDMMRDCYGSMMLNTVMKDSAEIDNAGGLLMSVYELEGPMTSAEVHKRAKVYLDAVNKEIELLIRKTWPSHLESLREEGVV